MRAPDGSYEDGLTIPGTNEPPSRVAQTRLDLSRNNPLSLDDQVRAAFWLNALLADRLLEPMDGMVRIYGAAEGDSEGR